MFRQFRRFNAVIFDFEVSIPAIALGEAEKFGCCSIKELCKAHVTITTFVIFANSFEYGICEIYMEVFQNSKTVFDKTS